MLVAEYDYDMDIMVQREESYNAGREEGIAAGIERGIATGRAEGIVAGIERGREEGIYTKAIETARNCLVLKMPLETISMITGLSMEEIAKL